MEKVRKASGVGWAVEDLHFLADVGKNQAASDRVLLLFPGAIGRLVTDPLDGVVRCVGGHELAVEIVFVHVPAEGQRLGVGDAVHALGMIARQVQRWHQNGHQNRNDRDNHEQFDKGKGPRSHFTCPFISIVTPVPESWRPAG
jgi:hypothetical protein